MLTHYRHGLLKMNSALGWGRKIVNLNSALGWSRNTVKLISALGWRRKIIGLDQPMTDLGILFLKLIDIIGVIFMYGNIIFLAFATSGNNGAQRSRQLLRSLAPSTFL